MILENPQQILLNMLQKYYNYLKHIHLILFLLLVKNLSAQKNENYLLVGTYTSGIAKGIYVYKFNGNSERTDSVGMIKINNPSFLAASATGKFVYAVNEEARDGNGGNITSFSFNNKTGELSFINEQLAGGDHPCHVRIDKTGKWIIISNYTSGSFSVFPVKNDGSIGAISSSTSHKGSSINKERQKSPHVHSTTLSVDNKFLFVIDLGIDKIMKYSFDERTGEVGKTVAEAINVKPGAGPRHFTFHPNGKYAYLVEELYGSISAYNYSKGNLKPIQNISTLPRGFNGFAGSAEVLVSPDGKYLYASNRGESNTIVIYKINKKSGKLTLAGHQSTLGKAPRNFNFDPSGNYLFVANQESDEIVVFKIDHRTGLLTDTGKRIHTGKPVCLKWIPVD